MNRKIRIKRFAYRIASFVARGRRNTVGEKKTFVGGILRSSCESDPNSHVMTWQLFNFFETKDFYISNFYKTQNSMHIEFKRIVKNCKKTLIRDLETSMRSSLSMLFLKLYLKLKLERRPLSDCFHI